MYAVTISGVNVSLASHLQAPLYSCQQRATICLTDPWWENHCRSNVKRPNPWLRSLCWPMTLLNPAFLLNASNASAAASSISSASMAVVENAHRTSQSLLSAARRFRFGGSSELSCDLAPPVVRATDAAPSHDTPIWLSTPPRPGNGPAIATLTTSIARIRILHCQRANGARP